jgi:hypothetical protein
MRSTALLAALLLASAAASAAPLTPAITGYDFNFGAYNTEAWEYRTNGDQPDTLVYDSFPGDHEVTAFWPSWPNPPVYPVWNQADGGFGGDFALSVQFPRQDAPYVGPGGTVDVSLVGTGGNTDPGAPDLEIFGTISIGPTRFSGLLWALDLSTVSLYGYSNHDSYVLEGVGTIVGGFIAEQYQLIGKAGAMRGNLDFPDRPAGWMPPLYSPSDETQVEALRAAYSGETGAPEPASCLLLAAAMLVLRPRR